MSRSTPLSNLPNSNKESSNAYDENENTLVKEILQEIDTEKNQKQPQPSKDGTTTSSTSYDGTTATATTTSYDGTTETTSDDDGAAATRSKSAYE